MQAFLGIDLGTTSVKVGLFDVQGCVGRAGREYQLSHPASDHAEIDAHVWWDAAVSAVREVLASSPLPAEAVAALCISSQGETVVAVDAAGDPLAPALVWLDNRAVDEAASLASVFAPDEVYRRTGIPDINPTWTAPKLAWWRVHRPEVFDAADAFLLAADFIVARLTGARVGSASLACTSLLCDITTGDWWDAMLDAVGVTRARLPRLIDAGSIAGVLTDAAASALGLPPGIPVVHGGMDQSSGAIGAGNLAAGTVSESTGGALVVQATCERSDGDPSGLTPVYVHSAPGLFLFAPVCPTGGMALTWFRDAFGAPSLSDAAGRSPYDLLTDLAAEAPAGCDGLVMLPHLAGAFSPEYVPEARGVFAGISLSHTKAHFVRAVLEAVAFMLRRNLDLIGTVGPRPTEIRATGGGSRSDLWNQIKADVCGLPVVTLDGDDAAVRGDAMLAAVAVGAFADLDAAASALVRPLKRFEPTASNRQIYDEAFDRYVALFDATSSYFTKAYRA